MWIKTRRTSASRARRAIAVGSMLPFALTGAALAGAPPNDDCSTPEFITGSGFFVFDTTGATTGAEGQNNQGCDAIGITGIEHDVWFCWTATCDGAVRISTCGLTNVDTRIALYDGCGCPDDTAAPLCCDDNGCGEQSSIICDVECGRQYMIQLGNTPGGAGGPGEFSIDCIGDPCPPPPGLDCCTDFNDGDDHGWTGGVIDTQLLSPGPSGDPTDIYLHCTDESGGPSVLYAPDACFGDWLTASSEGGCWAFCFDMRIYEDSCVPSIPECSPDGYIWIQPWFIIQNGSLRARFLTYDQITDDDGPAGGWHHFCAPIGPLNGDGTLPSNDDGYWEMLDGAPNSDWETLLSNVDLGQLRVEFTGNPAEEVGYDNLCFQQVECPCGDAVVAKIECEVGEDGWTGNYLVDLTVTNNAGVDVWHLLFPDASVMPNVISLGAALPDGASTTVSLVVSGQTPLETFCSTVIMTDEDVVACCAAEWCVELPDCSCVLLDHVEVLCAPDGTSDVQLAFTLTNLEPYALEHLFFIVESPAGATIAPDYIDLATVPTGGSTVVGPAIVSGVTAGDEVCVRVTVHGEDLDLCCSRVLCFEAPECALALDPCDLDADGVVGFSDVIAVLSAWGPCSETPCASDLNGDGSVGFEDLLMVLASWSAP